MEKVKQILSNKKNQILLISPLLIATFATAIYFNLQEPTTAVEEKIVLDPLEVPKDTIQESNIDKDMAYFTQEEELAKQQNRKKWGDADFFGSENPSTPANPVVANTPAPTVAQRTESSSFSVKRDLAGNKETRNYPVSPTTSTSIPSKPIKNKQVASSSTVEKNKQVVATTEATDTKRTRTAFGNYGDLDGTSANAKALPAIGAVVHNSNKEIKNGSTVTIRTTEQISINGYTIPKNSYLSGNAQFSGERVKINIQTANINGSVVSCNYSVYEIDGIEGIYTPSLVDRTIVSDATDQAAGKGGTTISTPIGSISSDALKKKKAAPTIIITDGHRIILKPNK